MRLTPQNSFSKLVLLNERTSTVLGSEKFRYGFQGKEGLDELSGEKNSYDFGARLYDSRLGRWLSLDALGEKYPNESPYCFVGNSPLIYIDPDGNTKIIILTTINEKGEKSSIGLVDYDDVVNMWKNTGTDIYRAVFDVQIEFTYDKRTGKTTRVKTICEKDVDAVEYVFKKAGQVLSDFDKKITGKGGKVKSGLYLVSKNDGAESTKFTATKNCEMRDVTDLIAYFSTLPYGNLPEGVGKKINTAVSKIQDLENVNKDVEKGMNLKTKDEEYGIQNSNNVPDTQTYSNVIMWRKPKSSSSNTGSFTEATPKQKVAGDTMGGNPTINVYPKK